VVRAPSAFSITFGLPPSITATQLLVVPKSIPMTLAIYLPSSLPLGPIDRHDHHRRPNIDFGSDIGGRKPTTRIPGKAARGGFVAFIAHQAGR
jgi:hypothetical protein